MLATLGRPPSRLTDFAVEAKYDGQRGLAVVDGGAVTLPSRNGADITLTFPEITAALPSALGNRSVVLDGEIVALDESGVPSFSRLQRRWPQNRRPSAELLRQVPARFFVLDILELDGRNLTRSHIRGAANGSPKSPLRVAAPSFSSRRTDIDPAVVLAASAELGSGGIVCKHLDSTYTPGLRSRDWIKIPL